MLTSRKIALTVLDLEGALSAAAYPLEESLSPRAFVREDDPADDGNRANAVWLGTPEALERLGLKSGSEVTTRRLAAALLGRHAVTGIGFADLS